MQMRLKVAVSIVMLATIRVVSVVMTMFPLVRVLCISVMTVVESGTAHLFMSMSMFVPVSVHVSMFVSVNVFMSMLFMLFLHTSNVVIHLILM